MLPFWCQNCSDMAVFKWTVRDYVCFTFIIGCTFLVCSNFPCASSVIDVSRAFYFTCRRLRSRGDVVACVIMPQCTFAVSFVTGCSTHLEIELMPRVVGNTTVVLLCEDLVPLLPSALPCKNMRPYKHSCVTFSFIALRETLKRKQGKQYLRRISKLPFHNSKAATFAARRRQKMCKK